MGPKVYNYYPQWAIWISSMLCTTRPHQFSQELPGGLRMKRPPSGSDTMSRRPKQRTCWLLCLRKLVQPQSRNQQRTWKGQQHMRQLLKHLPLKEFQRSWICQGQFFKNGRMLPNGCVTPRSAIGPDLTTVLRNGSMSHAGSCAYDDCIWYSEA